MGMIIKVELVKPKEFQIHSELTMRNDKFDASHIQIRFNYINGSESILQATGVGVHTLSGIDLQKYDDKHIVTHSFDVELKCSPDYFFGFVRGVIGHDYGFDQIGAIVIGKEANNDNENYICSELVGVVLQEMCGIDMSVYGDRDVWRPIHCYKALTKE